jgi:hypothetical protein
MNIKNFGDVCSKESQQFNQDQPVETWQKYVFPASCCCQVKKYKSGGSA